MRDWFNVTDTSRPVGKFWFGFVWSIFTILALILIWAFTGCAPKATTRVASPRTTPAPIATTTTIPAAAVQGVITYATTIPGTPEPTPVPTPTPPPTPVPTPVPTAVPSTGLAPLWQQGNPTLGHWYNANTYQCGGPNGTTVNGGPSQQSNGAVYFVLGVNGTQCGRDQLLPSPNNDGNPMYLANGAWYTWVFHYVDGSPNGSAPGMGLDTGADPDSLIWQIHGATEPGAPCTRIDFVNPKYYNAASFNGGKQSWAVFDCNYPNASGHVVPGSMQVYTPGVDVDWVVQVKISAAVNGGEVKVYKDGSLICDDISATYHNSTKSWWNYGIYKWRWEQNPSGSNMTKVQDTFTSMAIYPGQVLAP